MDDDEDSDEVDDEETTEAENATVPAHSAREQALVFG